MYNVKQFKEYIETTLKTLVTDTGLPMYSQEAVDLLMMTAAHESHLGTYLWQTNGPAQGAFMVEPETWLDTLEYIERKRWWHCIPWTTIDFHEYVEYVDAGDNEETDPLNLSDSIVIARMHYWRVSEPLPQAPRTDSGDDIDDYHRALADYAKKYYNTAAGKATADKYVEDYTRFVLDRS